MMEHEALEYKLLSDKAEEGPLTYEELQRLNNLHFSFMKKTYELAMRNEQKLRGLESTLEEIREALDEVELANQAYAAFLEQEGLTDEFNDYLHTAIDVSVQETLKTKVLN